MLLPSEKDGPVCSPHLIRDEVGTSGGAVGLAPWIVAALELPAPFAVDLLLDLPTGAPHGVAFGDDLRVMREVATLALETVVQGRVLPVLEREEDSWVARWRPLPPVGARRQRRAAIIESLPDSIRCAAEGWGLEEQFDSGDATSWNEVQITSPTTLVDGALGAMTDAVARDALWGMSSRLTRGGRKSPLASPARAWLAALADEDPLVDGDDQTLSRFAGALRTWFDPIKDSTADAFRACFRLSSPSAEEAQPDPGESNQDSWRLEFMLQARDDPSLTVPAEQLWRSDTDVMSVLGAQLRNPQERLLAELGRAMRLLPALDAALRTARPSHLDLDTSGAWEFLRVSAPFLERAGFGVQVPPWWNKPAARLGLRLSVAAEKASPSGGLFGIDGLCACRLSAALGDDELSAEELDRLARLKVPLVQVRGRWVEVLPEDIEQVRALLRKGETVDLSVGEIIRYAAGIEQPFGDLAVAGVDADGLLGKLLAGEELRPRAARAPAGFVGELRPYQKRGLSWLRFLDELGLGACLADDMGLGKTIQLLALLLAERSQRSRSAEPGPTLLICPMSVVGNWRRETERFAPKLRVHVQHGGGRPKGARFRKAVAGVDLVITTFALATRDRELLSSVEWHRVALDEAQNIKNTQAQQTRAVRALRAAHRVALTGTPVENRLSELWSIMQFLNPGLLGSHRSFKTTFANPIERYRDPERAAMLRRVCGPFILRRLKTDRSIIRDLPEKVEMKVLCHLTREQATLYQAVLEDLLQQIEASSGMERRGLVLATLTRLKQVCNHPAQLLKDRSSFPGRSGKLLRLEEILDEVLAVGDRALVFTQYTELGELLRPHLQRRLGKEVLYLHGGTSRKARDGMVERFQADDGPPVFLLSLKAGGTGLNLTSANHVIHFDRWWNPAVEQQATDRAFRIGQRKDVQVRKMVCVGTLEERIDRMIEEKKDLAEQVLGTGETWLTELSTAELRDVFALSADAVREE